MSDYDKPTVVDMDIVANLGPLAAFAGTWHGDGGIDIAPSPRGFVQTRFRERRTLVPFGPVINGKQVLYGLRYASLMWPEGSADPYHEETGYWLWDGAAKQVQVCFIVPRGVMVNAGGSVADGATGFSVEAQIGSTTFGVLSSPFLDAVFRTVHYQMTMQVNADGSLSYSEDTQLQLQNAADVFHHTDTNTLTRVAT